MKYTYARPGGPNITSVRSVRPLLECDARSLGPRYASTSTIRARRTTPPTRRDRITPGNCNDTSSVGCPKNPRPSLRIAHNLYAPEHFPELRSPSPTYPGERAGERGKVLRCRASFDVRSVEDKTGPNFPSHDLTNTVQCPHGRHRTRHPRRLEPRPRRRSRGPRGVAS